MNIAVVGQGYVGLPLAIAAVDAGHHVLGIDVDLRLIEKLNNGTSPIVDISNDQLKNVISTNRYKSTNDFSEIVEADVVVICVPTPLTSSHKPDYSYLEAALHDVAINHKDSALIIVESTVSPGTTRGLVSNILSDSSKNFELAYSPERVDPANRIWNISNTAKLVAGISEKATERAVEFYKSFVQDVVLGSSVEVIETAKLLENSFRLINISFANEMAEFCWKMKIDVREVIQAASTKPYGFMAFYPGIGIGGHCIPIDPAYLVEKADKIGAETKLIKLASEINYARPAYFLDVILGILGDLKGKKLLIIGVAYKPNVEDTRETPAYGLIQSLRSVGAKVYWHDELVKVWMSEKSTELSEDFDLAILANPHTDIDLSKLGTVKILDARGGY